MKILFDPQIFSFQSIGGISRYYVELIKGLLDNGNEVILPIKYSQNAYLKELSSIQNGLENFNNKQLTPNLFYIFNKLQRFKWFQINENFCLKMLRNNTFDIIHPTFYNPYFLNYTKGKHFVLTIYDMINEKILSQKSNVTLGKKRLAENASAIIAISQSTKNDIVEILGIPEEKIHVIHLASSIQKFDGPEPLLKLPSRYILFTGLRNGYKNFGRFLDAVAPLLIESQLTLICTGKKFTNDEVELFKNCNVQDKVLHINATDEELSMLYTNAMLFVFPSLYEGFGIPILEAFNCGCPVLLSDINCFREVAEDAGEYFDPYHVESIRGSIRKVIENRCRQEELQRKGFDRVNFFSWTNVVKETEYVYRKALQS